jgi:hypothetical protein
MMPESPAAVLSRAATLLRARAEAATAGPWRAVALGCGDVVVEQAAGDHLVADMPACRDHAAARIPDAEYVAAMHPGVALAVADWLVQAEWRGPEGHDFLAAFKVACRYLGETEGSGAGTDLS